MTCAPICMCGHEVHDGTCAYPLYATGGFYFRTCKCTHYTPREDK